MVNCHSWAREVQRRARQVQRGFISVQRFILTFFACDVFITAFTIFRDPDFCYEVMPKIFEYLTDNTKLEERDIYITFNDILPHHVGRNGKIFSNENII